MEIWDTFQSAEAALTQSRFEEAHELFLEVSKTDPERGWSGCARASLRLNLLDRARAECSRCGEGHWQKLALALLHSYEKRWEEVPKALQQCTSLATSSAAFAEAWESLYFAYVDGGRWDLAVRMLETTNPPGHYTVARGSCARQLGEPEREIQFIDQSLEEHGAGLGYMLARGEIFLDLGETEKAKEDFLAAAQSEEPEISTIAQSHLQLLEQGRPGTKSAQEFLAEGHVYRALRKMTPREQLQVHLDRNQHARAFELAAQLAHELKVEEKFAQAIEILESVYPAAEQLDQDSRLIRSFSPSQSWEDWTLGCLLDLARLQVEHGRPERAVELFEELLERPNRLAVLEDLCRATEVEGAPSELNEMFKVAWNQEAPPPDPSVDPRELFGVKEFQDGERVRGPQGTWFEVSVEQPSDREGTRVSLHSLEPYYPYCPANDRWVDFWLQAHGLSWGHHSWGFLGCYWREGTRLDFDFTRPFQRTVADSFDMESGEVVLSSGETVGPDQEGDLRLEGGVHFRVRNTDQTLYLTLIEPDFLQLPRIPGKLRRLGASALSRQGITEADRRRVEWLEGWVKSELGVEPGQELPWGQVEIAPVWRSGSGLLFRHQPVKKSWWSKALARFNKDAQ